MINTQPHLMDSAGLFIYLYTYMYKKKRLLLESKGSMGVLSKGIFDGLQAGKP